jgi:uncharacterized protein with HEPN domain
MEITVTREKLYPVPGRGRAAWKWIYYYSVDGAPSVQYGTSLAALRDRLKHKYPAATVTTTWSNR